MDYDNQWPKDTPDAADAPKRASSSQANRILTLAAEAELFHTPNSEGYASIFVEDHEETWPIKSKRFRLWLRGRYYKETRSAPNAQALQDALGVLESQALFEGEEHAAFVRLARWKDAIYLDLGNDRWQVVRITTQGWEVTNTSPVKFRRPSGMCPLPIPEPGGEIQGLRQFLNMDTESNHEWALIATWLLGGFRPEGPFPILVVLGEQGTGKSTFVKFLKALLDPNTTPLRAEPREGRDLMISATNSWLPAFDNLSRIEPWFSDALCRLSTGGGYSTRELYSDTDEILFDVTRPVVVNGIEELVTRADLLDRAILLELPTISEDKRKPEAQLWQEFEAERPHLLGAVLRAVSTALKRVPSISLPRLPRMADFALWATAGEPALGLPDGAFLKAYERNRDHANELALEASLLVPPIRAVTTARAQWSGTATELLSMLDNQVPEATKKQRGWPKNAKALSDRLRRVAPNLRRIGIDVLWDRGDDRKRTRTILIEKVPVCASAASAASGDHPGNAQSADALDAPDAGTPLYSNEVLEEYDLDVG